MVKLYFCNSANACPDGFEHRISIMDLEPESVDELQVVGVLEKLTNLHAFATHLYKIMKPDATVRLVSVYYACAEAWLDPEAVRGISEHSLSFVSKDWREKTKWAEPEPFYDFDIKYALTTDPQWGTRSDDAKAFATRHYLNMASQIHFELTKK
jgi:hypothetical protein